MCSLARRIGAALGLIVPALLAGTPLQARADVSTDYTLNFTTTSGSPTPTGSFIYDNTMNSLTSYTINWDGVAFDFTGLFGTASLSILTSSGSWCAVANILSATTCLGEANFQIIPSNNPIPHVDDLPINTPFTNPNAIATGTYTVTTASGTAVPEPSALALLGTALAGLILVSSRAGRRGPAPKPISRTAARRAAGLMRLAFR
jgi:hypothetical protein